MGSNVTMTMTAISTSMSPSIMCCVESAVQSASPAVLSAEHSYELMIFQQKLEDLSAQILEQRFVLAVQTIESSKNIHS